MFSLLLRRVHLKYVLHAQRLLFYQNFVETIVSTISPQFILNEKVRFMCQQTVVNFLNEYDYSTIRSKHIRHFLSHVKVDRCQSTSVWSRLITCLQIYYNRKYNCLNDRFLNAIQFFFKY